MFKSVTIIPIDNESTLVQARAWRQSGDMSLAEAMIIQFTDAYQRHPITYPYSSSMLVKQAIRTSDLHNLYGSPYFLHIILWITI